MSNGFDFDAAPNIADAEEAGFTFQVRDPEGEPMWYDVDGEQKPVTWTVVGAYSKTCKAIERKQLRALLKNARNGATDTVPVTRASMADEARSISCGDRTMSADGVTSGP